MSDSLNMEGSIRALKMAMKGKGDLSGLIHHSDRGIQYCSKLYTELLTSNNIEISMSEKGNPYENAVAERVNGILKEEFMLGEGFNTKAQAYRAVKEAIETYNEDRPHMSINYMTPNQKYAAWKKVMNILTKRKKKEAKKKEKITTITTTFFVNFFQDDTK